MIQFPELKIKIKSLATEATIIRTEEKKLTGERRNFVHNHRVIDVRQAQRATLLAYGYLRGMPYRAIERTTRWERAPYDRPGPDWAKVAGMVVKYGPLRTDKEAASKALQQWREIPAQAMAA